MLNDAKEFMIKMFSMAVGVRVWLVVLMFFNMILPLVFIRHPEALATFIAVNIGFLTGVYLYKIQGFTRLLGALHWPWIFLLPYLWGRLDVVSVGEPFGIWIRAVLVLNILSLILDIIDVLKYAAGDRKPIL